MKLGLMHSEAKYATIQTDNLSIEKMVVYAIIDLPWYPTAIRSSQGYKWTWSRRPSGQTIEPQPASILSEWKSPC